MPKQAKSVQMRHKVPKYVANVWQWRTPAGDRSTAAVCLAMIYTVYKSVGFGLTRQTADFHDTAQIVTNNFTFFRNPTLNCPHFEDS